MTREHYQDLLLDYVYGLLDQEQAGELRDHLSSCTACRTALAHAQSQQHLLARAARVIPEVPQFVAPKESAEAPTLPAEPSPMGQVARQARSGRRYWVAGAAAAALMVAALGLTEFYRSSLARHEALVAQARQNLDAVEARFAALSTGVEQAKKKTTHALDQQVAPQLQVMGPAQVTPDVPLNYSVTTSGPGGQPLATTVTTTLVNPTTGGVLYQQVDAIQGQGRVQLPGIKIASPATQLLMEAKGDRDATKFEETLQVAEASNASQLVTNKSLYFLGEMLFFRSLTLDRYSLKPPAQPVPLHFSLIDAKGRTLKEQSGQTGPGGIGGGELALTTDLPGGKFTLQVAASSDAKAQGAPQRVEVEILRELAPLDDRAALNQPVPAPAPTIDFFPEGGDLVAGVPNRVYYRIEALADEAQKKDGQVIVKASNGVIYQSAKKQQAGSFTFTPDANETYTAEITGPPASAIKAPFAKLGIKSDGVVLHAPASVGREGEPMEVILRNQGSARRLVLQVTCRGQIVDQQYLDLQPGSLSVKLQPAPGTAGVLRVTALEAGTASLAPVAERLLFLLPTRRLDVSCQLPQGPGPYAPGSNVEMSLKTSDESKKAATSFLLAAVVDERYREGRERNLVNHFYLAGECGGDDDIDNVVLEDTPAARARLDLLLGTQGWRRFVRAETNLTASRDRPDALAAESSSLAQFFSLRSPSSPTIPGQTTNDAYELKDVIERANQERAALLDEREVDRQALDWALSAASQFRQLPGEYVRLALGALVLALLGTGALLLSIGTYRLLRGKGDRPLAQFAGAFGCFFLCMFLYLMEGRAGPSETSSVASSVVNDVKPWPEFADQAIKVTSARPTSPLGSSRGIDPRPAPFGFFAVPEEKAQESVESQRFRSLARGYTASAAIGKRSQTSFARAQVLGANPIMSNSVTELQGALLDSLKTNEELQRRFNYASAKAKDQAAAANPPARGPAAKTEMRGAGGAGGFGGGGKAPAAAGMAGTRAPDSAQTDGYFREYAHKKPQPPVRVDLQETLLWHPNLIAQDGNAKVSFDASQNLGKYRILIYANSSDGRLGFYEGSLEVRPGTQK